MDELLKTITGFLANNRINLTNLVLSGITAGLNVLLEEELFDCPKEDFRTYGYMFLFAPFIIFLLVNMMAIVTVWDLTKITPVIPTIPRVFVAPILWLIVSFAESSYYVCAKVGRKPTNESEKEAEDFENMMAKSKTESQYIAWGLFIGMVAVIFLVNICYGNKKVSQDPTQEARKQGTEGRDQGTEGGNQGTEGGNLGTEGGRASTLNV